jgi:ABC-type branched-subunit amino acid transport system permease subunit
MGLVFIAVITWAPDGVIGILRRLASRRNAGAGRD